MKLKNSVISLVLNSHFVAHLVLTPGAATPPTPCLPPRQVTPVSVHALKAYGEV